MAAKSRVREIDLAADLQDLRDALALQPLRDVADRAGIGGHVLADRAVAAGGGGDELGRSRSAG